MSRSGAPRLRRPRARVAVLAAIVVAALLAVVVAGRDDPHRADPSSTATTRAAGWDTPVDGVPQTKTSEVLVVDGRVKLATILSGSPAQLQVVDLETNEIDDAVDLPGMSSGAAMAVDRAGRVYAGGDTDVLYRYTPGSGAAEELGSVTPSSTHVFALAAAPDGRIWGGSYPKAEVWHVDPVTGAIESGGPGLTGASYARHVAVDSEHLYVAVGPGAPGIVQIDATDTSRRSRIPLPADIQTGIIGDLQVLGRYLAVSIPSGTTTDGTVTRAERRLYDLVGRTWEVPSNVADQPPSPLDAAGNFYYLSGGQLLAVDSRTGVRRALASTDAPMLRDRHVVAATIGGVTSEWLISFDSRTRLTTVVDLHEARAARYPVDLSPVPQQIKTLAKGDDQRVFVGGFGGASLSVVNIRSGAKSQFPKTAQSPGIGEIEGSAPDGRYQYLGSYPGAQIFRYDREQPWVDGSNPALIADLGGSQGQDRPRAWATAAGRVYFGTIPRYGLQGGGLGIVAPDRSPTFIRDVVPKQSVVAVTAADDVVVGGTSRWGGLGAAPAPEDAVVFAYDAARGRKLWQVAPLPGAQSYGAVMFDPAGRLWAAQGGHLLQLDPATGKVLSGTVIAPTPQRSTATYDSAALVYDRGTIYLATAGAIYAVDPRTSRSRTVVASGVSVPDLAVVGEDLVYPSGPHLKLARVG